MSEKKPYKVHDMGIIEFLSGDDDGPSVFVNVDAIKAWDRFELGHSPCTKIQFSKGYGVDADCSTKDVLNAFIAAKTKLVMQDAVLRTGALAKTLLDRQ